MAMYAIFKAGAMVDLTSDAEAAAEVIAEGCGDRLRKVTSLEELAEIVKLEQVNACAGDDEHAGKQVVGMFNDLRAELERGARRLLDQARSCDRQDLKQQAKDTLEKVRVSGLSAMEELRRKIHAATADRPPQKTPEEEKQNAL